MYQLNYLEDERPTLKGKYDKKARCLFAGSEDYDKEDTVPNTYNESYFDGEPQRILDSFGFYSQEGDPMPLEKLGTRSTKRASMTKWLMLPLDEIPLLAFGHVLLPEQGILQLICI